MNDRPVFIPCASGPEAQTDCAVMRYGSLIRVLGHGCMEFTPADAARLAETLRDKAVLCGWIDAETDDGR